MEENKSINIELSDFVDEGLYLLFPDATRIDLTKQNIENTGE